MNPETIKQSIQLYYLDPHFPLRHKRGNPYIKNARKPCVKNDRDRKELEDNIVEGIVNSMWRFKNVYGESFSLQGYKLVVR